MCGGFLIEKPDEPALEPLNKKIDVINEKKEEMPAVSPQPAM